jgi:hypothetical protein
LLIVHALSACDIYGVSKLRIDINVARWVMP